MSSWRSNYTAISISMSDVEGVGVQISVILQKSKLACLRDLSRA